MAPPHDENEHNPPPPPPVEVGAQGQSPAKSVPKLTCKFSGTEGVSWEEFEAQIDNERQFGEWNDALSMAVIRKHLTGGALQTLRAAPATEVNTASKMLEHLKNIYARPDDPTHYEADLSTITRNPGETLQNFEVRVRHVVAYAHPETDYKTRDRIARQTFIDRLGDPELSREVKKQRPKDLHAACVEAQFLEDINGQSHPKHVRQVGSGPDKLAEFMAETQKTIIDMQKAHQEQVANLCQQFSSAISSLKTQSTPRLAMVRSAPLRTAHVMDVVS
ncbi:Annexin A11 [Branchiostoma belcheri]|nr:Annexin A11 [Branchiostoma belcheri]